MIATGKGARRRVDDVHLSRYACYLIVQNADPEKPVAALGQTYFAMRTREQELTAETLTKMSEEQKRLFWREEFIRRNRRLAAATQGARVIKPKDFALFQDHGYIDPYNGKTARDIAARKGLTGRQHFLDYMGAEELGANIFRATQADAKIKRDGITARDEANAAHHLVERAVMRLCGAPLASAVTSRDDTNLRSGSLAFDGVKDFPHGLADGEHAPCWQRHIAYLRALLKMDWMPEVNSSEQGARLFDEVHLLWHKRSSMAARHDPRQLDLAYSERFREALSRAN